MHFFTAQISLGRPLTNHKTRWWKEASARISAPGIREFDFDSPPQCRPWERQPVICRTVGLLLHGVLLPDDSCIFRVRNRYKDHAELYYVKSGIKYF